MALIRLSSFAARIASRRSLRRVSFATEPTPACSGHEALEGSPPESCSTIAALGLHDERRRPSGHLGPAAEGGDRQPGEETKKRR